MRLVDKIWRKWMSLPGPQRNHYRHTAYWASLYLVLFPGILWYFLLKVYDLKTESLIKTSMPEEVNDSNFNKWLAKQHAEGRFLDEKFR
mmetsp:Transcript_12198/g.17764  ORF Transcript_12198/g.17764 Transcript_12198/m.17764 type:complete len:89 (+) Transcript_12198:1408-1674(+)